MSNETTPVRVLFVDDEENILNAIRRLFMDEPFELLTADSGMTGLDVLKQHPDVGVIVSDQRMPGMSGAEFLEQSRPVSPEAVRIILTGYADITAAVDAINKGGAWKYLSKPWKDDHLLEVVREAAEGYSLRRENRRLTEIVNRQNEELRQWSAQLEYDVQNQPIQIQRKNEELGRINERLRKTFRDSISAFAGLLELRDRSSVSHSRNVSEAVSKSVRDMKFPPEEAETITVASLLHDIGKIGIPDVVLIKNVDAMNAEEKEQYFLHPIRGQAALDAVEYLRAAGKIIRHHHEAYDGSGFPDRLRGDEIPAGARIIAIADFFDRAFNQHQGSNGVDLALHKVREQEGKKFDASLCRAMENALKTIYGRIVPKSDMVEMELSVSDVTEGMTLARDVRSGTGLLLLGKGMNLDMKNIQAVKRYHRLDPSKGGVYVWRRR